LNRRSLRERRTSSMIQPDNVVRRNALHFIQARSFDFGEYTFAQDFKECFPKYS
jgi:hypothetical protein